MCDPDRWSNLKPVELMTDHRITRSPDHPIPNAEADDFLIVERKRSTKQRAKT